MMTMKLLYYDEVTPPNYEPPGFKAAECDGFRFDEEPTNIKVGDVATPFHTVKMRIKTDGKQFEMKEDPVEVVEEEEQENVSQKISNNGLDDDNMDVDISISSQNKEATACEVQEDETHEEKKDTQTEEEVTVPDISPAKPSSAIKRIDDEVMSQASEAPADEFKVRCPCGCNEDDGLMIMCATCKFWQHGVCFLIVDEDQAPDEHFCDVCATDEKECTDPQLSDMSSIAVQATCLWRRALQACMDMNRILAPHLARRLGIEVTVAQGLINRLEKEKFVRNPGRGKKLGKIVDKSQIKTEGIPKYFKRKPKSKKESESSNGNVEMDKEVQQSVEIVAEDAEKTGNEVDMLVQKTEGITLSGRKLRSKDGKKSKDKMSSSTSETFTEPSDSVPKRAKKRAFSKVDDASEFELCSSQDVEDNHRPSKKKKASVVTKAIMV